MDEYQGPALGDLPVSRLAMRCVLPSFPILAWGDGHELPGEEEADGSDPAPERVAAVVALPGVEPDLLARFRDAVIAGEPGARRAWTAVTASVRSILPDVDADLRSSLQSRSYGDAARDAPVVVALATMVGDHETVVTARVVAARAAFAMRDLDSTIAHYELALGVEDASRTVRCAVHDNLALALTQRGGDDDLDRAVEHFTLALALADTPADRTAVRSNRADALTALGYFDLAVVEREAVVRVWRDLGMPPVRIAVALDNWALALQSAGELERALAPLVEAAGIFPHDELAHRSTNAMARQQVLSQLGRTDEAAAAFVEAFDLAREAARAELEPAHFRAGLRQALHTCPQPHPDSVAWFVAALGARAEERRQDAEAAFSRAAAIARDVGDSLMFLRCAANVAAMYADFGEAGAATALCRQVRGDALSRGLAAPAAMVTGTMAVLRSGASEGDIAPVRLFAESERLDQVNRAVMDEVGVPPDHFERHAAHSVGKLEMAIASIAHDAGADRLAETYLRAALAALDGLDAPFERLNRTAGLLDVIRGDVSRRSEAEAVAADLLRLLSASDLPDQGRLVGHRALAAFLGAGDAASLPHLRAAADAHERLRRGQQDPDRREGLERSHQVIPALVSALVAQDAPADQILTALQRGRARRLLDVLGERSGGSAEPPDAETVRRLVARLGADQALVEITAVHDGLLALVVTADAVHPVHVTGSLDALAVAQWGDAEVRAADVAGVVRGSPLLAELVAGVETVLPRGAGVLVVTDNAMANLPLHLVPVDGSTWGRRRSYGRVAAAGVLAHSPAPRGWQGVSLVAGDSRGDLPGAAAECAEIAALLGTEPVVGPACSLDRLSRRLQRDLDVVHLAVHGRADVRRGGRGSLLLADGDEHVAWTPFDELARLPWRAQVIVLSGCSTAVGGPRDGVGLYGVAQAAAEAGATTVLASLWPVADDAASAVMTALHRELAGRRAAGDASVDLRDLLRTAVVAVSGTSTADHAPVRGGREFGAPAGVAAPPVPHVPDTLRDALRWDGFVVLGDPVVHLQRAQV